jgi:hypothetical protein
MSQDKCPDCGASVSGGQAGCQSLWDETAARAFCDLRYATVHDLAFDSYCMQHVEKYCRSAKSYAAHLTRLCCGLEFGPGPAVYSAIQRWLNGQRALEKPRVLSFLGQLTIADVQLGGNPEEHARLVHAWAGAVWEAYAPQHDLARAWIAAALAYTDLA